MTPIEVQQNSYCTCGDSVMGKKCQILWYHADCSGLSEETVPLGLGFAKKCGH